MSHFTVCTYNMCKDITGYQNLCKDATLFNSERLDGDTILSLIDVVRTYDSTQTKTAQLLIGKADVYFLQGVGKKDRILLKAMEKQYEILHLDTEQFETAIAIDPTRFIDIKNLSKSIRTSMSMANDVAIAQAVDAKTKQSVLFVSACAPTNDYSYCAEVVSIIEKIRGPHMQIIGMNRDWPHEPGRFCFFTEKKFEVIKPLYGATSVHKTLDSIAHRPSDCIFFKHQSMFLKAQAAFVRTMFHSAEFLPLEPLGFDPGLNASNHIPVFAKITTDERRPYILNQDVGSCAAAAVCLLGSAYLAIKKTNGQMRK